MCDGIINEKLEFIRELMKMERPEESQEYMQDHMGWSVEELKTYRDKLLSSGDDFPI